MPLGLPGSPSALLSSSQGGNVGSNDDCFSDPCFVPGAVSVLAYAVLTITLLIEK